MNWKTHAEWFRRLGGSHHQAMAYGAHTSALLKLAMLMDIPVQVI